MCCYTLDLSKPIWLGKLKDCCDYCYKCIKFNIINSNGKTLTTNNANEVVNTKPGKTADPTKILNVVLSLELHLEPQQTRMTQRIKWPVVQILVVEGYFSFQSFNCFT